MIKGMRALVALLLLWGLVAACGDDSVDEVMGQSTESSDPPAEEPEDEPEEEPEEPEEEEGSEEEEGGNKGGSDEAADEVMDEVEDKTEGSLQPGTSYESYSTVSDDSGALFVDVPDEWSELDGAPLSGRPALRVSDDLQALNDTFTEPGLYFLQTDLVGVGAEGATNTGLDSVCTFDDSSSFEESELTYTVAYYLDCAGTDTTVVDVFIQPSYSADAPLLEMFMPLVTDADLDALDEAIASFSYDSSRL
jgi:hypothetical protein